jgi:hypothetical protein
MTKKAPKRWKAYASVGIIVWAAALQVGIESQMKLESRLIND